MHWDDELTRSKPVISFLTFGVCSGLAKTTSGRGVTPVYLRCSAGRVTWIYPRGALRVLLRLPFQEREFRACLKVHPDGKLEPAASLYLEGPRSLIPLYSHSDSGNKIIKCFNSKNGQAAIYVEAAATEGVAKRVSEIEYDLRALPKGIQGYEPIEECRPCSKEEMTHAFCTSDLVTRGEIDSVRNRDEVETLMTVRITKLIRQTISDGYSLNLQSNSLEDLDIRDGKVSFHVAQRCGVSYGVGEFVFMARRKLGELTLECAPRLEDWALLVNKLSIEGTARCVLRS